MDVDRYAHDVRLAAMEDVDKVLERFQLTGLAFEQELRVWLAEAWLRGAGWGTLRGVSEGYAGAQQVLSEMLGRSA